jgi:hypothetical protein
MLRSVDAGGQRYYSQSTSLLGATVFQDGLRNLLEHDFIPRGDGGTYLHVIDLRQAADLSKQRAQSGWRSGPALALRPSRYTESTLDDKSRLGSRLS